MIGTQRKVNRMSDDTISRQAAIDAVSRGCQEFRGIFAECEKNLSALPSAERHGKWKIIKYPTGVEAFGYKEMTVQSLMCSNCSYEIDVSEGYFEYCPNCGSFMDLEYEE